MAVNLSPIWGAGAQLLDNSGNVLSGGKIYTYAAGTTTPATTYTSSNGITANSNPIILNSAGRVPYEIWLTDGISYKFVLKDSNDVLIATYDNLTGINSNFIAYTAQQEIQTATAGQTVFTLTTMQYQPGTNNLSVFVDGVNQYGPGAQYAYVETDTTTVTFVSGLHEGASVKFTTATPVSSSSTDAQNVSYEPPFTGSVGTNVEAKLAQTVSVKDFGAVGDGVTDDTSAIQAAIDSCVANGQFLYGDAGTYLVTSTITMNCSGDLSEMTINADGKTITPIIRIGAATGSPITNIQLKTPKLNNTAHIPGDGWVGYETNVGISIDNLFTSILTIPYVWGFGIGIYVGGTDFGCSYNNITIASASDSKINLLVDRKTIAGWSNDNTYYIGNLRQNSSETDGGVPYAGTRNLKLGNVNNNVFIKPCVEGNNSTVTEYFVELINSTFNTFINPRWENSAGAAKIRIEGILPGACQYNCFIGGYDFGLDFTTVGNVYNNSFFGGNQTFVPTKIQNPNGGGETTPLLVGYSPSVDPLAANITSGTDWSTKYYASGLQGKRYTDAYPRYTQDWAYGYFALGDGTVAPTYGIALDPSYARLNVTGALTYGFVPSNDNSVPLGYAGHRWSVVYAGNGTINTSDERTKQDIVDLTEVEKKVAIKCKYLIRKFKFKDAVIKKGDKARTHVGVIAQEVIDAFKSENLDPFEYGIVCYDKWDATDTVVDESGKVVQKATSAGDSYGIRYEQLLTFIIGAM